MKIKLSDYRKVLDQEEDIDTIKLQIKDAVKEFFETSLDINLFSVKVYDYYPGFMVVSLMRAGSDEWDSPRACSIWNIIEGKGGCKACR